MRSCANFPTILSESQIAVLSGGCEPPILGKVRLYEVAFDRALVSSYKPLHTYYFCISNHLPEILDCSFQWGLRTPNYEEGEA